MCRAQDVWSADWYKPDDIGTITQLSYEMPYIKESETYEHEALRLGLSVGKFIDKSERFKLEGELFIASHHSEPTLVGDYSRSAKEIGFYVIPKYYWHTKHTDIYVGIPLGFSHLMDTEDQPNFADSGLLGTFGVDSVELFNQRLKQFETSDIELKFELESDEAKNLYLLKISKDFFDQQFSYATKHISVKDEGFFALSKEEISELNEKIIDQIDSIQIKMKVLLEKGGEFEELDESALQKKSKIKNILRKLETEYEEYLELEEYYLSNKKDIDFLQKNIEYSPESKFIVKFIHELSEIEKEYYDITQLRQKLGINFPTIRFSLADLGFYAKTDQALGKDYIEIGNEELKWYISHFPEDSERLIKTLSLRKYKDSIKYLGTKRLAQFIRHGYFYFHQLEEEDANDIFVKTGVARGWVDNIKKQLPLARKRILSNK